jgi:hypothetical protein
MKSDVVKSWIVESDRCKLCGKVSYRDEDDAEYKTKAFSAPYRHYKCPYGNGWHLSSKPR